MYSYPFGKLFLLNVTVFVGNRFLVNKQLTTGQNKVRRA